MSKATPAQVRYHFNRIEELHERLAQALNDAHHAEVLMYEYYEEQSPCFTNNQTFERILETTEKQLARAMRHEIRRDRDKKRKKK